jgi:hypothetical protein
MTDPKPVKKRNRVEVVYIPVPDDDPINVRIRRLIPQLIDQYVKAYRKPIRRQKLEELAFTNDAQLMNFYEQNPKRAKMVLSFELSKLVREGKVVKAKDPDRKRPTYYILPEHKDMFNSGQS